ncbi:MAG: hypothetical protein U1D55_00225 [Phycisphaerae bacterium]
MARRPTGGAALEPSSAPGSSARVTITDMSSSETDERRYPHAYDVHIIINELARRLRDWTPEGDLLNRVESQLRELRFTCWPRPVMRWTLFDALRQDSRVECRVRRLDARSEFEFRCDADWSARFAAETIAFLEQHRVAGEIPSEYVLELHARLWLFYYETTTRFFWRDRRRELQEREYECQALAKVLEDLGWDPRHMGSNDPKRGGGSVPNAPVSTQNVERLLISLRPIAGGWHDRLRAAQHVDAIRKCVGYLQSTVDRAFDIAHGNCSHDERNELSQAIRSGWNEIGRALPRAGLGRGSGVDFRGIDAAIDGLVQFAGSPRDSNCEADRSELADAVLAVLCAWRELEAFSWREVAAPMKEDPELLAKEEEVCAWLEQQIDRRQHAGESVVKVSVTLMLQALRAPGQAIGILEQYDSVSKMLSRLEQAFPDAAGWFVLKHTRHEKSVTFIPGRERVLGR